MTRRKRFKVRPPKIPAGARRIISERVGPTPEQKARRIALVGNDQDPLASYPLGVLLARDLITQQQHDAGRRYAWLRGVSLGNPLTRNEPGHASPLSDSEQADIEREWRRAAHVLRQACRKTIVDTVCVYERPAPDFKVARLRDGLDALAKSFLTGRRMTL